MARRQQQIDEANAKGLGDNPIHILGGEDFPQSQTITININGGLFTGHFRGRPVLRRQPPAPGGRGRGDRTPTTQKTQEPAVCLEPTQISYYRYEDEVPNGCGDGFPKGNKIVDMGVGDDQHATPRSARWTPTRWSSSSGPIPARR